MSKLILLMSPKFWKTAVAFANSITSAVAVLGKGSLRLVFESKELCSKKLVMTLSVATNVVTDAGISHFAFHFS